MDRRVRYEDPRTSPPSTYDPRKRVTLRVAPDHDSPAGPVRDALLTTGQSRPGDDLTSFGPARRTRLSRTPGLRRQDSPRGLSGSLDVPVVSGSRGGPFPRPLTSLVSGSSGPDPTARGPRRTEYRGRSCRSRRLEPPPSMCPSAFRMGVR